MKVLKDNEIRFIKDTRFTPTVWQCNEWSTTTLSGQEDALLVATNEYGINFPEFLSNVNSWSDSDFTSLEYMSIYVLNLFYTRDTVYFMSENDIIKALQSWKYYFAYNNLSYGDAAIYRQDALDCFDEKIVLEPEEDGTLKYVTAHSGSDSSDSSGE